MHAFSTIKSIFSFIGTVLTWLRNFVANILFILLITLIILGSFVSEKKVRLPANSVLCLDPSGILVEQTPAADPVLTLLENLDETKSKPEETKLQVLIDTVHAAATNDAIKAMIIAPGWLQGCDTSKLLELGSALRAFKKSGKPIWSYASAYSQGQYLLASYADRICVSPLGGVLITGYGNYQAYFKNMLDNLHITMHVYRVGNFKSAVEPFTRTDMSEYAKIETEQWLTALWGAYRSEIAANRKISPMDVATYVESLDSSLETLQGNAAKAAQQARLIDDILPQDEFEEALAEKLGTVRDALNFVSVLDYPHAQPLKRKRTADIVAIIRARGTIVSGYQSEDMIGSETVREMFERVRNNPRIASVVLRLDSPGGSATASEEIYREILRTQDAGKPVVISMGSVAASGAYWIASAANHIVATPTTLTGSIGIFAAVPSFENAAEKLGITTDGVGTTSVADLGNPLRPMPSKAENAIPHLLRFGYDAFLERVAKGRGIPLSEVENSAQGRVFIGTEALERKLVDELGDMDQALFVAGQLAGLEAPETLELQRELSPREAFFQALSSGQTQSSLPPALRTVAEPIQDQMNMFSRFTDPQHLYTLNLECMAASF